MTWVYHGISSSIMVYQFRTSKMCASPIFPARPRTLYGVFKLCNEGMARIYWQDHGIPSEPCLIWDSLSISWSIKPNCQTGGSDLLLSLLVTWSTQGGSSSTDYLWRWKRNRLDFRVDQSSQGSNPRAPLRDRGQRVGSGLATWQRKSGFITRKGCFLTCLCNQCTTSMVLQMWIFPLRLTTSAPSPFSIFQHCSLGRRLQRWNALQWLQWPVRLCRFLQFSSIILLCFTYDSWHSWHILTPFDACRSQVSLDFTTWQTWQGSSLTLCLVLSASPAPTFLGSRQAPYSDGMV